MRPPILIRFITGAKAFGATFSSFIPETYSNFTGTVTTDLGDTFTFRSGPNPAFAFFGLTSTNSFYSLTYSDGAVFYPLHEELVGDIYLVLNPPPELQISFEAVGQVDLKINGSQGQTVVVETSTNLATWQALATNRLASDQWIYSDPRPISQAARYYRTTLR